MEPRRRSGWSLRHRLLCAALAAAWAGLMPAGATTEEDAVPRAIDRLRATPGPVFYAVCDLATIGSHDRFIWLFGDANGAGVLIVRTGQDGQFWLVRNFTLAEDGKSLTGDVNFGTSFWDRYGAPGHGGGLLTDLPDFVYHLALPGTDFWTAILAEPSAPPCPSPTAP